MLREAGLHGGRRVVVAGLLQERVGPHLLHGALQLRIVGVAGHWRLPHGRGHLIEHGAQRRQVGVEVGLVRQPRGALGVDDEV